MIRAEPGGAETRTAKAAAMQFLRAALAGGPAPAAELSRRARALGLTTKGIRTARAALNVRIARVGFGRGSQSIWALPGGHMDAHPTSSQDEVSASREEDPTMSEAHQPTVTGYAVLGVEPDAACEYCGQRGADQVFLMQGLYRGGRREPLHALCATYLRDFYRAANAKRGGQV
jgi:hypothetical protein